MRAQLALSSLFVLALTACSSDPTSTPTPTPSSTPTSDPAPASDEPLPAPPPGAGLQYRMVSTSLSGQEIERCQLFKAPPEGLLIRKDEVRFNGGSHHVLLYKTPYTEIPTMDRDGSPVDDATKPHDCAEG